MYTSLSFSHFQVKKDSVPEDLRWQPEFDQALETFPNPKFSFDFWQQVITEYEELQKEDLESMSGSMIEDHEEVNVKAEVDRMCEETKPQGLLNRMSNPFMNESQTRQVERESTAPEAPPSYSAVSGGAGGSSGSEEIALNRMTMITGAPTEKCRDLLASVGWDLQRAVQEFYEHDGS
mmetsp:Transcript_24786/g.32384  ORF Transcript_24786/g.32384 Transcript_24786/m.32384 type:complete len:178 (-) Transcript_24786:208-741(-)